MRVQQPILLIGVSAVLISVSIVGCAGTSQTVQTVPEKFPLLRTFFGETPSKIVVIRNEKKQPILILSSRERQATGTAKGAAGGALLSVAGGCRIGFIFGCLAGVVVAPVGAVAGAIAGTETSENWSTYDISALTGAKELLEQSISGRRPRYVISSDVVDRLRMRTHHDVRLQSYHGDIDAFVRDEALNWLIEIELTRFGFIVEGNLEESVDNPSVAVFIAVLTSIYSVSEEKIVFEKWGAAEYQGKSYKFQDLRAEDGRLFEKEIKAGARALARHIVG